MVVSLPIWTGKLEVKQQISDLELAVLINRYANL